MNDYLKQLALDHGCDPHTWNANQRRAAVVEWYRENPESLSDALADLADREAKGMMNALEQQSAVFCHAALGIIVERFLLNYPLDAIEFTAVDNLDRWREQDYVEAMRNEADSFNDARKSG